jgi:ABC-type multidrug transport system fused ATPase/permease subunit
MNTIEFYVGLAVYIGTTLSIIMIFRESGNKLEVRANNVSREKRPIVSGKYLELIEKTIQRFATTRTLSEELEQEYESISSVRFGLNHFTDELTEIVDRLTQSIVFGVASVIFTIFFGYLLSFETDVLSFWATIGVGALAVIAFYRYITDGLGQIRPLRRFEKWVNEIERCGTFDQLHKSLDNQD